MRTLTQQKVLDAVYVAEYKNDHMPVNIREIANETHPAISDPEIIDALEHLIYNENIGTTNEDYPVAERLYYFLTQEA